MRLAATDRALARFSDPSTAATDAKSAAARAAAAEIAESMGLTPRGTQKDEPPVRLAPWTPVHSWNGGELAPAQ